MPCTCKETVLGPEGVTSPTGGQRGSASSSSAPKPQSSIASVTEGIKFLFSTIIVAELFRALTNTCETPEICETISVMETEHAAQVIPLTARLRRWGTETTLRSRSTGVLVSAFSRKDASISKASSILGCEGTMRFECGFERITAMADIDVNIRRKLPVQT